MELRVSATALAEAIMLRFDAQVAPIDHWCRKLTIIVIIFFLLLSHHLVIISRLNLIIDLLNVLKLLHHHSLLLALPENAILTDLQLARAILRQNSSSIISGRPSTAPT